jgi:DNA-binding NtrC family response regulator
VQKILVVENDTILDNALRSMLESEQLWAVVTDNPEEAVRCASAEDIELILSAVVRPCLDHAAAAHR